MLLPQMPALPACCQRLLRVTLAALLSLGCLQTAAPQTTYDELAKAIKAPNAIAAIGNDLFGDQVNLYNGALEFHQTDVSQEQPRLALPGRRRQCHQRYLPLRRER